MTTGPAGGPPRAPAEGEVSAGGAAGSAGEIGASDIVNPRAWGRTFASLAERDYAWYFTGNVAFFMAMQMNLILRGYLAIELTDAAIALGIVSLGSGLPMLAVAPFGGVLADRVNKRTLLISMQTVVALFNLALAVLILTGQIEFWHLVIGSLGTGTVIAIVMPTRQALVPQLVPQHKLMNAISLQMGGMNLTRVIGPALAGLLAAPLGIGWVYMLTVALFVLAVVSILPLPVHGMVASQSPEDFREDLVGGFRFVARSPLFRLLLATALIMPLFALPVQQILPVFSNKVFEGGALALGILMASTGVGGLIGAGIAANLDNVARKGAVMLIGTLMMGVSFLAFALTPVFLLALLFLALGSVGRMLFMVTNNTVIQAEVPDAFRGRVMSLLMMSFGMMPLGVLPLTAAADVIGAPAAVALASCVMLVIMLTFFALSPMLRNLRLEALGHAMLSPAQAAKLVAEGEITQEEADRMTGRAAPDAQPSRPREPAIADSRQR